MFRGFEIGDGAVGEVLPAGDLARDEIGYAADREVGVAIRDQNGRLHGRVEFPSAQRCADAGRILTAVSEVVGYREPGRSRRRCGE